MPEGADDEVCQESQRVEEDGDKKNWYEIENEVKSNSDGRETGVNKSEKAVFAFAEATEMDELSKEEDDNSERRNIVAGEDNVGD